MPSIYYTEMSYKTCVRAYIAWGRNEIGLRRADDGLTPSGAELSLNQN